MKPIILLSDLRCVISKLHSFPLAPKKCFNKRRLLVSIIAPYKQRISPGRSIFSWQCSQFDGICIPLDLPNFNETLDQRHKSNFRLLGFLDKNSIVMTLFSLYMENFCHWFLGQNSYVMPAKVWNGCFFKPCNYGLKKSRKHLLGVLTLHISVCRCKQQKPTFPSTNEMRIYWMPLRGEVGDRETREILGI